MSSYDEVKEEVLGELHYWVDEGWGYTEEEKEALRRLIKDIEKLEDST